MSQQILDQLTPVLRDVFDNDALVATRIMTADMVEGWDSLTNVQLFVAIEQNFAIRFSVSEIGGLKNVGELVDLIAKKKGASKT